MCGENDEFCVKNDELCTRRCEPREERLRIINFMNFEVRNAPVFSMKSISFGTESFMFGINSVIA